MSNYLVKSGQNHPPFCHFYIYCEKNVREDRRWNEFHKEMPSELGGHTGRWSLQVWTPRSDNIFFVELILSLVFPDIFLFIYIEATFKFISFRLLKLWGNGTQYIICSQGFGFEPDENPCPIFHSFNLWRRLCKIIANFCGQK